MVEVLVSEERESVEDHVRRMMDETPIYDQKWTGGSVGYGAVQAMELAKVVEPRRQSTPSERLVTKIRKKTCVDGKLLKFRVELECGHVVTVFDEMRGKSLDNIPNLKFASCEHCRKGRT